MVDIGSAGRQSDGRLFNNSALGIAIENKSLNFLQPKPISGLHENKKFPYTFVADETVLLIPHMTRPYPRRGELNLWETIFNYRLSRGKRVIESTFGNLVSRFRNLHRPIIVHVNNAKFITKAAVNLHNFLMISSAFDFLDQENGSVAMPGQWCREVADMQGFVQHNNYGSIDFTRIATEVRDNFKDYFNSVQGSVPWQDKVVNSTKHAFHKKYWVFGTMKLQLIKLITDKTQKPV